MNRLMHGVKGSSPKDYRHMVKRVKIGETTGRDNNEEPGYPDQEENRREQLQVYEDRVNETSSYIIKHRKKES